ncbi:stimulated by retinoic acid gene 6 protein-like isoform X2 [Electrophorus electricus]|uniref:stimulated by retinoic acid gene 6 protein-like isoform X2 n=1 Tax=Electrophorus electricus TaxID=8005 RepID=UPI0015D047FF|nr:stimulated by retinoic acid gene 6 protein-like isoform X2 [Electrophorus electricus]
MVVSQTLEIRVFRCIVFLNTTQHLRTALIAPTVCVQCFSLRQSSTFPWSRTSEISSRTWSPKTIMDEDECNFWARLIFDCSWPSDNSQAAGHHGRNEGVCLYLPKHFLHGCLLPSVCIVVLLSFVERRRKIYRFEERFPYLRGRFGVVVPLDFTGTQRNRWSYAFAFGAAADTMVHLLTGLILPFSAPKWIITFVYLLAALEVGVAYLPFFACLSTPHRCLGGVLGLIYTLMWLTVKAFYYISCWDTLSTQYESFGFSTHYEWVYAWPSILCLGLLIGQFGFMIVKNCQQKLNNQWEKEILVQSHQFQYVQTLLRRSEGLMKKSWFRRKVYDWDPYFKFPNRMIGTAVISLIGLYLFILTEQILSSKGIFWVSRSASGKHLNYFANTWYVTTSLAALSSVAHISHVLVCYRKHIKRLWAGNRSFLPEKYRTLNSAVSMAALARYPGCQIAFVLWGYLIVHFVLFIFGMVLVYLVIWKIELNGFLQWLKDLVIFLSNFIIMMGLLMMQVLLVRFFFLQDKLSPEDQQKPLALNNRKAFHNFNYFFFFYNVILGVGSCVLRLFANSFVGLLLVSRIDRTIMPRGYELMDKGYHTWIGMIMADHYHSNPITVCFCHLLLMRTLERERESDLWPCFNSTSGSPVVGRARARWLLVYTLLRNPKLVLLRNRQKCNHDNQEELLQ